MQSFDMKRTVLGLTLGLLGQASVAFGQTSSAAVPVVATFFATAVVMLIIFAIVLYCLRKKWKQPAQDRAIAGGFDNPLVLERKENGEARSTEENELQEVITEPNKEEQPPKTNHEGYQERAVDVAGVSTNGKLANDNSNKGNVHTVVLSKTTPTNGFNIVSDDGGNIFIRDIRKDGPATGKLVEGDIIESVTVFYEGIAYEDALNVLSFAAPYKVAISLVRGKNHLMPGSEENRSDPFVQELQRQLEKRGSEKKPDSADSEKKTENDEIDVTAVAIEKKPDSSSSSSSSSDDEKEPVAAPVISPHSDEIKHDLPPEGEQREVDPASQENRNDDDLKKGEKDEGSE